MTCCSHGSAAARVFDQRVADRDRRRYQKNGPDPTTRTIVAELARVGVAGRTLLDVGGGIGVIGLELAGAGIDRVMLVEASPAYEVVAQAAFQARNLTDRLTTRVGDFADLEPAPAADLVTLDRVVCCYPDFHRLLERAADGTGVALALSFPNDRWYVRLMAGLERLVWRVRGNPFRTFVHPPAAMAAIIAGRGLRRVTQRRTLAWCVELWTRV